MIARLLGSKTGGLLALIVFVWIAVALGRVLSNVDPVNRLPRSLRVIMNPDLAEDGRKGSQAPDV